MTIANATKHTPGPWHTNRERNFAPPRIFAANPETGNYDVPIARLAWHEGEHDANSELMAAAPEMLEILRGLEAHVTSLIDVYDEPPITGGIIASALQARELLNRLGGSA
jgi:hypothetical protein